MPHAAALLGSDDHPPLRVERRPGSRHLVVCDHAARDIPVQLGNLGLRAADLDTHIASDIGAQMVARHVASRLDATLISAAYSRLVIDCNRYPWDPGSIAAESAGIPIPGNVGESTAARVARVAEIFLPYQRAIATALDELHGRGSRPMLLSIHSCTPQLHGRARPWPIGLSYVGGSGAALDLIEELRRLGVDPVGDNEPYTLDLGADYTVPEHALRRGLDYVQVEFRQDLVADEAGAVRWGEKFVAALIAASGRNDHEQSPWAPVWRAPHEAVDAGKLLVPPDS